MKVKKKVSVEDAIQFQGNDKEIMDFCPKACDPVDVEPMLLIPTTTGIARLCVWDWLIKGVKGDFQVYTPNAFAVAYDIV